MISIKKNIALIVISGSVLILSASRAQDAKFAADNLKYSRDFYSKVHFVAVAELPQRFKYDRYQSGGPERIECDSGTYFRQHGKPWRHVDQKLLAGLPINYAENDRYLMTFARKDDWGRFGESVDKETTRKPDSWIKLVDAAFKIEVAGVKPAEKSEAEGRAQWVFEAPSENPNGVPTRFTFRKPVIDKAGNVLLHEFAGSLQLQGEKIVPGGAADQVRFGFGYMMRGPQGYEVSERVWEEIQQASEEKAASSGKGSPGSPAASSGTDTPQQSATATEPLPKE